MERLRATVVRATEGIAAGWRAVSSRARFGSSPRDGTETGQGLAEYALILGLIAIVAIASLTFLGETVRDLLWDPISADFRSVLESLGILSPT